MLAPCATRGCGCRTLEATCSPGCRGGTSPTGSCECRHEGCGLTQARGDLYPPILDRFRPDRLPLGRPAAQ